MVTRIILVCALIIVIVLFIFQFTVPSMRFKVKKIIGPGIPGDRAADTFGEYAAAAWWTRDAGLMNLGIRGYRPF